MTTRHRPVEPGPIGSLPQLFPVAQAEAIVKRLQADLEDDWSYRIVPVEHSPYADARAVAKVEVMDGDGHVIGCI